MSLLVDTSVWSLALRRDTLQSAPHVHALRTALTDGTEIATTGVILLELLQGAVPEKARTAIRGAFDALRFLEPERGDYEEAAALSNRCRGAGMQLATVDALIAQLAIRHELTLLTTDRDFSHAARHIPLRLWNRPST